MALPKFILLKSSNTNKFLRYRKEVDSKHALLEFSQDENEENAQIRYAKFEVQKSQAMEGFVHIRSCYNNKYWVRKSGDDGSKWIAAEANEAEEDSSKLSCTLFKAVPMDAVPEGEGEGEGEVDVEEFKEHGKMEPQRIRLVHVDQVGEQGCVAEAGTDVLALGDARAGDDDSGVFTAYDATSLFVLPAHIALAGHSGQYAALTTKSGVTYIEFKATNIGTAGVVHRINQWPLLNPPFMTVYNTSASRHWMVNSGNYIVLTAAGGDMILHPTPIRLAGNLIALQDAMSSDMRFANCGSGQGMEHALARLSTTITQYAMFGVEEPVLFRRVLCFMTISNVEFNLADSRVYNVGSVEKFRDERRNNTSSEQTGSFSVEYSTTETKTWSDSVTITTGVTASLSVSIPYVGIGFGVELSEERSQTIEFGTEQSETKTVTYQQSVTMPPRKKVTLVVLATQAQCDVPFTCRVVDTLSDGTRMEYDKTDGLFTGANEFSFITDLLEEDL
ncbi:hypothetical protein V2J09_014024 [Rumex salicifolius]